MSDPAAPPTYAEHVVDYAQAGWPCVLPVPPRKRLPEIQVAEPVALYRHGDHRGELLYVGITNDPGRRWEQHRETSIWARFVAATYVQWFPDRRSARAAERQAIRQEQPIFNAADVTSRAEAHDRQIRYLRTGTGGGFRRVPCQHVTGDFCASCGPDADAWFEAMHQGVMREIEAKGAIL